MPSNSVRRLFLQGKLHVLMSVLAFLCKNISSVGQMGYFFYICAGVLPCFYGLFRAILIKIMRCCPKSVFPKMGKIPKMGKVNGLIYNKMRIFLIFFCVIL